MLWGSKVVPRAIESGDFERLREFQNDLEIEVPRGGEPHRLRSRTEIASYFEPLNEIGSAFNFATAPKDNLETAIGHCGLFNLSNSSRTAELGITFGDRSCWGRGYGRDSVGVLVDYAFRIHNLRKITLWVHSDNERARRSYEAAGFEQEAIGKDHMWSSGGYADLVAMS
ncbi:Protein N-acetyltransferase, RimJ/RimL family [Ferrithrix thermotolerans DSM 19514]|uniref:Protein N-acetyltransferase, RimJ/RimL family n=1 Tax=Ferrithrix thermotolerans DSM 19514 TaxID=1121881 RepID=A0A1M4UNS8_9ACTN|nr:GNAT family protein [Ferrithrix thermotolerans]SHE58307.1 Protein N-acetyltransferase, RimJ/RimL family [Ferrithrix thermotolerans DSM 19514]